MQFLFWWEWLTQEVPPLQRSYLSTYFHSTEEAKHPSTKILIEPLFKTAPGRKRQLILAPDVISGRDGDLLLRLSQIAIEKRWTGIAKGPRLIDDSAEVKDFLREDFYESRGFWH